MRSNQPNKTTNRRGALLVFAALSMVALLSTMALAIDVAMLYDAHRDAQRTAEAAALAGASAFQYGSGPFATSAAYDRAKELAAQNSIQGTRVDTATAAGEVDVTVIPAESKVRVRVGRAAVGTFFARVFGVTSMPVRATAAAATKTGARRVGCLKPFMLPDMWDETSAAQDANGNRVLDGTEQWQFDPGDSYIPWTPGSTGATGYGSDRNGQYPGGVGLPLQLVPQDQLPARQQGGNGLFVLDGNKPSLAEQIAACMDGEVGNPPSVQPTTDVNGLRQGVQALVDADQNASWNSGTRQPNPSPSFPDWRSSPRLITVGLFDPNAIRNDGSPDQIDPSVTFNNFARIWLDGVSSSGEISAHFLGAGPGGTADENGGMLLSTLRLVE